jgi:hypothetical protein
MIGIDRVYGLMPSTKSYTQPNHTVQVNRMGARDRGNVQKVKTLWSLSLLEKMRGNSPG